MLIPLDYEIQAQYRKTLIVFLNDTKIKRTILLASLKQEALKDKSDKRCARTIC